MEKIQLQGLEPQQIIYHNKSTGCAEFDPLDYISIEKMIEKGGRLNLDQICYTKNLAGCLLKGLF